ncbi:Hikeshi heat shock protein nuclear import factor [Paragonimus heterotremus]|uniref:Hikeshi heat shock protein nuclear import factor n=1 Tax=Paragonimus heterotremus TaxID=100268 RepID=A0A8J4T8E5_9TREM|nr:Hikeshi heat shock protein nuclear import factor [Paragonimus heterotremus]
MFAAIVSGNLVQTEFVQVCDNKFLLTLAPLNDVNHIVVFLTGTAPFLPGMGGGVYLGLQQGGSQMWYFLGILTNDRPSAIFKVGNLRKGAQLQNSEHPFGATFGLPTSNGVLVEAQLGISVESLTTLPPRSEGMESEPTNADQMTRFTRFAAESLFNYVASFAHDSGSSSDPLVPMSAIKGWFGTILHKLTVDPCFWQK